MKTPVMPAAEGQAPVSPFSLTEESPRGHAISPKTITALFEERARLLPGKTALVFKTEAVTYDRLNERASQLAAYLRAAGVQRETLVAVCLEQSVERVVSMLAILKAGGAYVPVDPHYPVSRIGFILDDTQAPFLVTTTALHGKLPAFSGRAICIDDEATRQATDRQPAGNPAHVNEPADIAYVIYTSGSTGTPKGVLVEHRGLSNFTRHHSEVLGITESSKALQFSSTSFDAAVIDLWIPLLQGATLHLYPNNRLIGAPLLDYIRQHAIDILPLVSPTVLSSLPAAEDAGQLRVIGIGGEACPERVLQGWRNRVRLVNSYGPTEATVAVTSFTYRDGYTANTIGRPGPGVQLYILDDNLRPVEDGATGELFIGGVQVARGYLNRPEITREKFIPHPLPDQAAGQPDNTRLYRTGDLVKQLPDGNLEFVGRKDNQVKIRGYRIELGEIESALLALEGVKQAVVLPRGSGFEHTLLAAFLTHERYGQADHNAIRQALREQLQEKLPAYMVPDRFELLESMPLTTHGKIDKDQLQLARTDGQFYIHPATGSYEDIIHAVWARYLQQEQIQPSANFFALGGHSLLLTQVYTAFPPAIQQHIQLPDLYAYPTIQSLAAEIRNRQGRAALSEKEKEQAVIRELQQDAQLKVPVHVQAPPDPAVLANPRHIFLTGATGFVGAHLLAELLEQTGAQISCLVRAGSNAAAMERLRQTFSKFLLPWNTLTENRIQPVTGDLSKPFFGLDNDAYNAVAASAEVIYHSGSSVSYLQPYPVIKGPNIDGLQEVIRLATTGKTKFLALLSSMGVFSWGRPFTGKTWMTENDDIDQNLTAVSKDLGYIKSKWVMEKMMQAAMSQGLPVINFRLGFAVCHGRSGATVMNQWWGSLVRSCVLTGAFPLVMGLKDELTTVDYMSKAIVHIAKKKEAVGMNFHLSPNPENDVSLTDFFAKMNEYYGLGLKGLPYHEWLRLWRHNEQNPLYPLLSLFTDDVHEGKSLVESYEHTYYYDRSNTRAFLDDSDLQPPVFDKKLMTPYLRYMGILP